MITPVEMKLDLPMHLSGGQMSTTTKVWEMLTANRDGDVERFRQLAAESPAEIVEMLRSNT